MKTTRRLVQLGFLIITLVGVFVVRGHAERWCPFGGVEAIYQYASDGNLLCSLGVSNFYVLLAVLALTLLARRAFCGYVCPIGTLSEWFYQAGRALRIPALHVSPAADRALALLKYALLVLIALVTWRTGELIFRGYDPCYALIGRHGDDITVWAYVISGILAIASLAITVPLCRWLCPLAAVLTPFSRFGLTCIERSDSTCTACAACTRACPMAIPVHKVTRVTAGRCTTCFECVDACPSAQQGTLRWGPPKSLGRSWPRGLVIAALALCIGSAVAAAYLVPIPAFVQTWGPAAESRKAVALEIDGLTCRGRATLLVYFLQRDDELQLSGFVHVAAWPAPRAATVQITYDPAQADEETVKQAIISPYFDSAASTWRPSPFRIIGYDPWGIGD